jgi:hypothetical protein
MPIKKTTSVKANRWLKIKNWIKNHKILSGLIAVVLLIIILPVSIMAIWGIKETYYQSISAGKATFSDYSLADNFAPESINATTDIDQSADMMSDSNLEPTEETGDIPGLEIKQADITVSSREAVKDEEKIRTFANQYNGYVESSQQLERPGQLTISMKVRLPASSFDIFIAKLKNELDVEKYNIRDFRLEIKQRQTQLDIIELAIERYLRDFSEVSAMSISEEKFKLSENLISKLERYQQRMAVIRNDIDNIEYRSKMAEIDVALEEDLPIDIWPDNVTNRLLSEVQKTIDKIIGIGISLATFTLIIFLTVIKWLIYLLAAVIPVWIAIILIPLAYQKFYR